MSKDKKRSKSRPANAVLFGSLAILVGVAAAFVWFVPYLISLGISRIEAPSVSDAFKWWLGIALLSLIVFGVAAVWDDKRRRDWVTLGAIVGGLLLLSAIVLLIWVVPPSLFADIPDAKDRATLETSARTGILAALAGVAAIAGLAVSTRTHRVTIEGQYMERYTRPSNNWVRTTQW